MEADVNRDRAVYSRSLVVCAMIFSSIVMAANFSGQKPLLIFGLIVSSGSAIFPLTYLISVLVTELFGREYAKSIIFTGFICNILVATFIILTLQFPHPAFWNKSVEYNTIMGQTWKIFLLSSLAYIVGESTNLYVFNYLSKLLKHRFFQLRVFFSTMSAVVLDTLFLIPIMMGSSPTYGIIIHKMISLIIFKCFFIFSGILFIASVRDYIIRKEKKALIADYSSIALSMNDKPEPLAQNIFWYKSDKRSR